MNAGQKPLKQGNSPGSGSSGHSENKSPGFNRSLGIFAICLVFATILWFLNALSKNYTTSVDHPVELTDLPRNTFISNNPPDKLHLKVHAYGFELLRYKLGISFTPIILEVEGLIRDIEPSSAGLYVINTNNIKEIISNQLGSEIQLLDIFPGVFTLAFDSLGIKQVPVGSRIRFNFKPRFDLAHEIKFNPELVTVTGPREIISHIDTIYTVSRTFNKADAPVSHEIALVTPRQTYIEPQKVMMKAEIEEFTEKSILVPVWVDKQPDNLRIRLFPNEVEVTFKTGLSEFSLIKTEDFGLFVTWNDIKDKTPSLKVKINKIPLTVKSVRISPENVEYLIEKN